MLLLVGGFLIQTVDTYITWPKKINKNIYIHGQNPFRMWMFSKKGHILFPCLGSTKCDFFEGLHGKLPGR